MKPFLLVCLLSAASASAGTVPAWHWSNGHIRYLEDRGLLADGFRTVQPYSYRQLRTALAGIDRSGLAPEEAAVLRRLENFLGGIDSLGGSSGIRGGAAFADEAEGWLNPYLAYGFSRGTELYTSFRVMNARDGYDGKKYAGMNAYNDQGVLQYENGVVSVKIGRDYLRLGPGAYGQLLLSSASPAFDQYRVDLTGGRVRYSFWGLALDERNGANRFINGHRLTLRLPGRVEAGLNEMVIYGGPLESWRPAYMNPVLFYHGYSLNTQGQTNTLLSMDADWQASRTLRVWTELLVDDFQIEKSRPRDLEPAEIGITLGACWSGLPFGVGGGLTFEFTQVTHRTYNAPDNDWEKYLHRNIPTGYYLPAGTAASNDFQSVAAAWNRWWHPRFASTVTYRLVRRGEGTIQGVFNTDYLAYTPAEGYDEAVPFGTVETSNGITVAGELAWAAWLHAGAYVVFTAVDNPGNDAAARSTGDVSAGVSVSCDYGLFPRK